MKYLISIVIVLTMVIVPLWSRNNFIYIRYNPENGNASTIISTIDSIRESSNDKCVIFISNGDKPIIAESNDKWNDAKTWLLSMQVEPEYYPEDECLKLSKYFVDLFNEKINDDLHLKGNDDSNWNSTFIISDEMYNEESESLYLTILSNELAQRQTLAFMVYSANNDSLSWFEIPNNTIYE